MEIKKKKGFTLVEIIAVIMLLAVIAFVFGNNFVNTLNKNKETEIIQVNNQIIAAAETYVVTNPEEIENLYNGYGYIDIPVGNLRDAGLLSERLTDKETGELIPDERLVRVKINISNAVDIIYPITEEESNETDVLKMEALEMHIASSNVSSETWCNNEVNLFQGLYRSNHYESYNEYMEIVKSRLYLYTVSKNRERDGLVYTGNYFGKDESEPNLEVISCNVDPTLAGEYYISYQYKDIYLNQIKKVDRKVVVDRNKREDVIKFSAIINDNKRIVEHKPQEQVPIQITEYYADGTFKVIDPIPITQIESQGYQVLNFQTDNIGDYNAIVRKIKYNSDGSLVASILAPYRIVTSIYTLFFDPNGGVTDLRSKKVKHNEEYGSLANATRTGYTFMGWFLKDNREIKPTTIFEFLDDTTLYAHWTPNKYTVTFNGNGGNSTSASKVVTYDADYEELPNASRIGYDFLGWFTGPIGGVQVKEDTKMKTAANHTLYAHWKAKKFILSFDPNGGGSTPPNIEITYDSPIGPLPTPNRPGVEFDGWSSDKDCSTKISPSTKVTTTSNQTVYACWYKTHTVTFNNDGNIYQRSCKAPGESFTCSIAMNSFTPPKFHQATGWGLNQSSSTVNYSVGQNITVSKDMTVYSKYQFKNFYVNLERINRSMRTDKIEGNINLMFIVDLSGSMGEFNRLNKTKSVINNIINKMNSSSTVSIVTHYARYGTSLYRGYIALEYGNKNRAIDIVNNFYTLDEWFENYTAGIRSALDIYSRKPNNYPNYTIFITDAQYRASGSVYISPNNPMLSILHTYSTTYTVGIGELSGMEDLLQKHIASSTSKHFQYSDSSDINSFYSIFEDITKDILIYVPNETTSTSSSYTNSGNIYLGNVAAINGTYPFKIYLGNRLLTTYYNFNSYFTRSGSSYYFNLKSFLNAYSSTYGINDYNKQSLKFRYYNRIET